MTYGLDTYCYDRLVPGRLVSGPELVAQAVFRRLTTPRGTLRGGEDESVYGLDLQDFIGTVGTSDAVDALPDAIATEVKKDDRVDLCDVEVTADRSSSDGLVALLIDVTYSLHAETDTFTLSVRASDLDVSLLGLTVNQ